MTNAATASPIDDYIAMFPPAARKALEELRALALSAAPGVTESISYGIISFDYRGRKLVYFGGWKKHIGFYPVTDGVAETFGEELRPYKSGKGSLRFQLDEPIPLDLVRRILKRRVEEVSTLQKAKGAKRG